MAQQNSKHLRSCLSETREKEETTVWIKKNLVANIMVYLYNLNVMK